MALQDLGRGWWQKIMRPRTVKNPAGVPNRRCKNCGHEVSGTGPEPTECSVCHQPWQSAEAD